jgi:histidyl-tRNA synthetase
MLRGTRVMMGEEAGLYNRIVLNFRCTMNSAKYQEVILPNIWEQQTFIDKGGMEIIGQMYSFQDKGDRDICLIPEATAIIQQLYNENWKMEKPKPVKVFYVQRCYRYDRPQAGRYREFTQAGIEILGGKSPEDKNEATHLLHEFLQSHESAFNYSFKESVKRGLSYYIEDGFEVEVEKLGAQKQIAGGGRYAEGIGWAIGIDRLMLCK